MRNTLFVAVLLFTALFQFSFKSTKTLSPKKVVLMIGDGMGLAQVAGAMAFYQGVNAFERFPVTGFSKTSSADDYVTDSGAGATAISIGKKSYNNGIGIDKDTVSHPTLFELAKKKGLLTGVVVTSSVVHATPASFYAHVKHRNRYEQISEALLNGNCDVAIGGGIQFFTQRKDKRNLLKELETKGFKIIVNNKTIEEVNVSKLVQLNAADAMPKMSENRGDYLKKASMMAIRNLTKNPGGYLLMIEGSQIDWGGHDMNFEYMKLELRDFNEVINAVLDEAKKDGNTLVIVTADHETGGLALTENKEDPSQFTPHYTYNHHTGVPVPVFAYGPGAESFSGIYENTELFNKIKTFLGL